MRDIIRGLRSEGIAVFLNSHLLSEVELVCDRVAIVDQGRVVREGQLDTLVGHATELRLTVDRVDSELRDLLTRFGQVLGITDLVVTMGVSDPEVAAQVADAVIRSGYKLFGLVPMHRSLEDVFISLVERGEG